MFKSIVTMIAPPTVEYHFVVKSLYRVPEDEMMLTSALATNTTTAVFVNWEMNSRRDMDNASVSSE